MSDVKVMSSTVAVILAITWVANNYKIWTNRVFFNRTKLILNQIWVFQNRTKTRLKTLFRTSLTDRQTDRQRPTDRQTDRCTLPQHNKHQFNYNDPSSSLPHTVHTWIHRQYLSTNSSFWCIQQTSTCTSKSCDLYTKNVAVQRWSHDVHRVRCFIHRLISPMHQTCITVFKSDASVKSTGE